MAKNKKHKVEIKEQQRITPGSFINIQNNLNKYEQSEENKAEELEDETEDIDNEENEQKEKDDKEDEVQEKENSEDEDSNSNENQNNNNEDGLNNQQNKDLGQRNSNDSIISSGENINQTENEEGYEEDEEQNEIEETETIEEKLESSNRLTENINTMANKAKDTALLFVKIVTNPVFLVILLLLFIMAYMTSAILIIGQNDYNVLCDDMGVGSLMLDPEADAFTRQAAIASWLTSTPFELMGGQPLTREQAIGIMGNLIQESYGANPRAFQGDHSITKWENCDNNCILALGDVGGKAIGIIQWDKGRRIELVKFAISEGTEWHDLNTQLKYLKKEMDNGYELDQLKAGGFHEVSKSVADYVRIFNQKFERSADAFADGNHPRVRAAESFGNNYAGSGVSVAGGLANFCIGGMGGVDTSNLVQLAIASAWPDKEDSRGTCSNPGYVNCGQTYSMAAYKEIKLLAESNGGKDPIQGLLASCDRYVATMYKASGRDINIPWGGANIQGAYMRSSPKWRQISCEDRQPGDVLWRDGHVMLYLGIVNGADSIGSASLSNRTGAISGVRCSGSSFIGDGDTAIGFRMVSD